MASRRNWECDHCDGINGERDVTCQVCGQPRKTSGRGPPRKSASGGPAGGVRYDVDSVGRAPRGEREDTCTSYRRGGARPKKDDLRDAHWTCSGCTYVNNGNFNKCRMCRNVSRTSDAVMCPRGPPRSDGYRATPPRSRASPSDRHSDNIQNVHVPRERNSAYDRRSSPGGYDSRPSSRNAHSPAPRTRNGGRPTWEDCVNSDERRLVLLGKTGCGKSATGNTILSDDFFRSQVSGASVTRVCRRGVVQRNGKNIHVVDTPGVFDTEVDNDTTTQEIVKCIGMTAPGPHAFLLVVRIGRFTAEERDSVEHFIENFGRAVENYMIILFTGMDDLYHQHMTLEDHLRTVPPPLGSIIKRCGRRCIGFNNKATGREVSCQVDELMEMVEDLFLANNGLYYTNRMYNEAENAIQLREAELRSMAEDRKRRERQQLEEDNDRVYRKQLRKHEEQEQELERKLAEAESKSRSTGDKTRRTSEIDKDIQSIRMQMDKERRAGGHVDSRLQNKLIHLEKERDRIVKTESDVGRMQNEMQSLRGQIQSMKRKVTNTKSEQRNEKDRRLKELERKYDAQQNSTREVVRKEVEKGSSDFGDQLLGTVLGAGKFLWKAFSKLF